jgi:hypothetical protein
MPPVTPESAFVAAVVAVLTVFVREIFNFVRWSLNRKDEKGAQAEEKEYKILVKQVDDVHEIVDQRDGAGRPLVWASDPLLPEKLRELRALIEKISTQITDVEKRLIEHDHWERHQR